MVEKENENQGKSKDFPLIKIPLEIIGELLPISKYGEKWWKWRKMVKMVKNGENGEKWRKWWKMNIYIYKLI